MTKISIEEITKDVISYLQRVQAGENFVIFQADQPVAKIISAKPEGILDTFDTFRSRIVAQGVDLDGFRSNAFLPRWADCCHC